MTLASIQALPVIGEGNFRRAHRDGDYVYKVQTLDGFEYESNLMEYRNSITLSTADLPANVVIPEFTYLVVEGVPVIRMPYIEGKIMGDCMCLAPVEPCRDDCLPIELVETLTLMGIDCAYGNVILSTDGSYYLVDLDAELR